MPEKLNLRLWCKMFQTDVEEPLGFWKESLKAGSRGGGRGLVLLMKAVNLNCKGRMGAFGWYW